MNPPNDWETKDCLRLSLAVLLANLGLIGLAALGFDIPVLRQIVCFVFLTFIPGIVILRVLKIHNIETLETILYSVGLSLAFIMFIGALANFVLPYIGISEPISLLPVMVTLAVSTLILAAVAYIRDKDFSAPKLNFNITKKLSTPYLLLLLLPLIAIIGARLVSSYQNNFVLLFFIIVVAGIVTLAAFDKLPQKAYPLAIVMIALSLLLHITLISGQLSGYDIHGEYYHQNLVLNSGYWDFTILGNYNTALSVVLLGPIYSLLMNVDVVWVLKVVYPLIFSLAPLALFHLFGKQIGSKRAFLATFFFMSMPMFVTITAGVRNQIAQLFFALLILLMIDHKLVLTKKISLFVIFSLSLMVSHYAMGYIYLAFLIGSWIVVALIRSKARIIWEWLTKKFGGLPQEIISERAFPVRTMAVIMVIYLVFMVGWYGAIAQGTALDTIRLIGQKQQSLLSTEIPKLMEPALSSEPDTTTKIDTEGSKILDPTERETLVGTAFGLDFASASPLGKGFRIFQYASELFIVVGFLAMIFRPKGFKFKIEFIALSMVAAVILLACIVIPRLSGYLHIERFYHITLFLLAPFCIVGGEVIWQGATRLYKLALSCLKGKRGLALQRSDIGTNSAPLMFVTLALLIPYFLFNSGFLSEITGDEHYPGNDSPHSLALSSYRLDMPVINQKEADAAAWLAQIIDDEIPVYADFSGRLPLNDHLYHRYYGYLYHQSAEIGLIPASGKVPEEAYIFFRKWNLEKQELQLVTYVGYQRTIKHFNLGDFPMLFENREVIYENASAKILAPIDMTE